MIILDESGVPIKIKDTAHGIRIIDAVLSIITIFKYVDQKTWEHWFHHQPLLNGLRIVLVHMQEDNMDFHNTHAELYVIKYLVWMRKIEMEVPDEDN